MDPASWPLWLNLLLFAGSACFVWFFGSRLSRYADQLVRKTRMGEAFAGLLLLGGATSLPELANVTTAAYLGDAALAVNSLLGSVAINVLLLALADAVLGRDALSSVVVHPTTMLQGTLGILMLAIVIAAIVAGEREFFGFGIWSAVLVPTFSLALLLSSRSENRQAWVPDGTWGPQQPLRKAKRASSTEPHDTLQRVLSQAGLAAFVILAAGFLLARTGEAIAHQTGLGSGIVGFLLIGFATSLPELSTMLGAVRLRRYEMAVGDVFGTNLFDIVLIPVADAVYTSGAILAKAGRFEILAALLGVVLTVIYLVGLLERRDRTIFRMGYDSLAVILAFVIGTMVLFFATGNSSR